MIITLGNVYIHTSALNATLFSIYSSLLLFSAVHGHNQVTDHLTQIAKPYFHCSLLSYFQSLICHCRSISHHLFIRTYFFEDIAHHYVCSCCFLPALLLCSVALKDVIVMLSLLLYAPLVCLFPRCSIY